jgi:gas vesicle protein
VLQIVPHDFWFWILGGIVAAVALLQMMLGRHQQLQEILRQAVKNKMDWMKKKAKAAHLAGLAARRKADEEADFQAQLESVSIDQASSSSDFEPSRATALVE